MQWVLFGLKRMRGRNHSQPPGLLSLRATPAVALARFNEAGNSRTRRGVSRRNPSFLSTTRQTAPLNQIVCK